MGKTTDIIFRNTPPARSVSEKFLLLLITNLTHFFNIFIFSPLYMFRAHSAHHQERQTVLIHHLVCFTLKVTGSHLHKSETYQMMY
jgi:hypothetical protein